MAKMNERIDVLETTLASKADKNFVEIVDTKTKQNSQKISGLASDLSKLNKKLNLSVNEQDEIDRRKNNVIMKGYVKMKYLTKKRSRRFLNVWKLTVTW